MNGQMNGGTGQMQVNPVEVARFGLALMQRVQFTAAERGGFDALEALLNAIAQGQVTLAPAPQPSREPLPGELKPAAPN